MNSGKYHHADSGVSKNFRHFSVQSLTLQRSRSWAFRHRGSGEACRVNQTKVKAASYWGEHIDEIVRQAPTTVVTQLSKLTLNPFLKGDQYRLSKGGEIVSWFEGCLRVRKAQLR
jgi:hypothetical protein